MTKEIREDRSCIMIYRNKNFEIMLPNPGLGLYSTPSLLVVPSTIAVGTRTFERRDQNLPTHYFRADPSPQGAAYTAYQTFDHPGPSRPPQYNTWEQATPQRSDGSWHSGQWQPGQRGPFTQHRQDSGRHSIDAQEVSSSSGRHHR
jgi:hypothetical protein